MTYRVFIEGFVPLICWASSSQMVCNDPNGYTLYAVRGEEVRVVEVSPGAAAKPLPPLADGFSYVVVQSAVRL